MSFKELGRGRRGMAEDEYRKKLIGEGMPPVWGKT